MTETDYPLEIRRHSVVEHVDEDVDFEGYRCERCDLWAESTGRFEELSCSVGDSS